MISQTKCVCFLVACLQVCKLVLTGAGEVLGKNIPCGESLCIFLFRHYYSYESPWEYCWADRRNFQNCLSANAVVAKTTSLMMSACHYFTQNSTSFKILHQEGYRVVCSVWQLHCPRKTESNSRKKSNSLYFIYLYLEKSNYMYVGESAPMIFDQNWSWAHNLRWFYYVHIHSIRCCLFDLNFFLLIILE